MGFGRDHDNHTLQSVLQLLNKQSPLSPKQEKFCNNACVERFLKAKGESVKKAAKHLRNCLSWRDSFGIDHLMADEFSSELAEGMAYVAGHDDELRPVMIFRISPEYQKFHSQKLFNRLLVFTLEVAIQTMAKNVEQFVLLFDASLCRSTGGFMNMFVGSLKTIGEYYPGRLHKAFVIDPPPLFSYLWKGVRPFVELSPITITISSLDFEESAGLDDLTRLCFNSSSSRFSDSKLGARISHLNARSRSFTVVRKGFMQEKAQPRTPKLSFQSPSLFSRSRAERNTESFVPYIKLYRRPYDEMIYRSKMRPPLGGLTSVLSPHITRTRISCSQRFFV
ncbi:phosphatidylinositol transfer protein 3-like isoform X1 [Salvia divinorum]|uniref:Phosphatidylinositol transfer protein 3-like isoform X1 n=1 Tax=Salvia divinorum TaxID=28513 RepID=A0ABD1FW74_SALDI